ncbi:TetR/AcrR family transcriptional regulator [Sphingomonas sp.]|uniref:TetR/AcrR family transcriptional regulator n=1 Tax=Sphingomonas sp. TaxID=28214 RepID=UPI003B00B7A6
MSSIANIARAPDLTPLVWLEAGQTLLRRGGLRALKLRPLADELGVSTGSFYHHFTDFDAYQGRLADYWAAGQVHELLDAIARAEPDPVGRIRRLAQVVRRRGLSRLSIAMRAWADSDPRAARAVERHDAVMLGFLTDCLIEAGVEQAEAAVRGYALMTLGLAKVHAPHLSPPVLMEALIGILCVPR